MRRLSATPVVWAYIRLGPEELESPEGQRPPFGGATFRCLETLEGVSSPSSGGPSEGSGAARPITERELLLLAFLSVHRLAIAAQAQSLLGVSPAAARPLLRRLRAGGLIRQLAVFHREPACLQITRRGLDAIESPLPVPRLDLRGYRHDVGAAWLWLAARRGCFGPAQEVFSERLVRSRDRPGHRSRTPLAVRLDGAGPGGGERLHYPDLVLACGDGRRIALELELTGKGRVRRERILTAYGADPGIAGVLYLVEDRRLGASLGAAARRLGLEALVHVQAIEMPSAGPSSLAPRARERLLVPRAAGELESRHGELRR